MFYPLARRFSNPASHPFVSEGFGEGRGTVASSELADGVVVGSALVNCISRNLKTPEKIPMEIGEKARELTQGLFSRVE